MVSDPINNIGTIDFTKLPNAIFVDSTTAIWYAKISTVIFFYYSDAYGWMNVELPPECTFYAKISGSILSIMMKVDDEPKALRGMLG